MHKALQISALLLLVCCFANDLLSQNRTFLEKKAKDLSSASMKGRGYVENGLEKAAGYLHHQFDSLGLKNFKKDYCQKFKMAVNTFPEDPFVSFGGEELLVGVDYHIDPSSGDSKGIYEPLIFSEKNVIDLPEPGRLIIPGKKLVLVLDQRNISDKDSLAMFRSLKMRHAEYLPVIVLTENKLTWSVSDEQHDHAIIEMSADAFPEDTRKVELGINAELKSEFEAMNMIGFLKGRTEPDSFIVLTAHYDHLGMMGTEACFYGANDNASGCAYLLELARHYAEKYNKYSMVFIAFAGEEAGLLGSKYFVEQPLFPLERIKFLLNIDLMGNGDEGITVVNGTIFEEQFKWITSINKEKGLLNKVKIRGPAANSDHYWFTQKGVPSFFIYTMGGSKAYHDVNDNFDNLNFEEFPDLFVLITEFLSRF
ncbi:MAG: M20/M25/M40 family metallo-hydrolase [Flavobacteriales bacterium]|nr:M20/M25/M40 family metallo-hydrolase [Flavobacteriales bacterium]